MIMKKAITTSLLFFIAYLASAQTIAVTENGDTITIYDNGTWEPLKSKPITKEIRTTVEVVTEVDEFEKTKKTTSEPWTQFGENTNNNRISGRLFRVDDITLFIISYSSGNLGCLSEYDSTMKVKLTNGDIVEFSQLSTTDCGDNPSARFIPIARENLENPKYIELLNENIELLKKYDWVSIRLTGSEKYTDLTPNTSRIGEKNAEQFFRQHIIAADNE